jgi:hydroxymethylbilane synthase
MNRFPRAIRVVSRPSKLALAQSRTVIRHLQTLAPDVAFELRPAASGEAPKDWKPGKPLPPSDGEKGGYVAGIRGELLHDRADLAVHCAKDVPIEMIPGLRIVSSPSRVDARDALVSVVPGLPLGDLHCLNALPAGTRIGTSSPRRIALIRRWAPQCIPIPMRGNVDSRMRHLMAGQCDALILAMAGLIRLRLISCVPATVETTPQSYAVTLDSEPEQPPSAFAYPLPLREFVPAPGQGTLVLEAPLNTPFAALWAHANHVMTSESLRIERQVAGMLEADCRSALGIHARWLSPQNNDAPGWELLVQRPFDGAHLRWQEARAFAPRAPDVIEHILHELQVE